MFVTLNFSELNPKSANAQVQGERMLTCGIEDLDM